MSMQNHVPAFLQELTEDAVLTASVAAAPIIGKAAITTFIMAVVGQFDSLVPAFRESSNGRDFLSYDAKLLDGEAIKGLAALTRNTDGKITEVLLGHAPYAAVLKLVSALGK